MKVLMFGWEFPPKIYGGLAVASYGITKGLSLQGDMETIFCMPKPSGEEEKFLKIIGMNQVPIVWRDINYDYLLFYVYEKLAYYDRFVKSGTYAKSDVFSHFAKPFHELDGKVYGIIGMGAIGEKVAEIAETFGCKVIYYSTSGKHDHPKYQRVTWDEFLEQADIVSIHAPLTPVTEKLVDAKALRKMKNTAVLLNLGRGPIVDQKALAEALQNDEIAAAGLDVLEKEPMEEGDPLLNIQDSSKLIITPHIAWATCEARKRCADEVCENVRCYLQGISRNVVSGGK